MAKAKKPGRTTSNKARPVTTRGNLPKFPKKPHQSSVVPPSGNVAG